MTVPFLDLGAAHRELEDELRAAQDRVLRSGRYVRGPEVAAFEAEFASYCGTTHCVGVGNGLDALRLVLQAAGVGPGHEVVVPGHTFIATWLAVTQVGATPAPVDVAPGGFNLDVDGVRAALTDRTRAVVPVHLYGEPADVEPLHRLAAEQDLLLLEDAAQAHGARRNARRAGSLGDAAAFSFYPAKNLGALGDGGAVVTDDAELAERVRALGNYGARDKYDHDLPGLNSRLDELQAAYLRVKLARLDEWNARRRRVAEQYLQDLAGVPDLVLPAPAKGAEPVWHLFVVRHPQRDELRARLEEAGVQTGVHYPVPPHRSGAYAAAPAVSAQLPETERLCEEVLSLPIGPHLSSGDVEQVVAALHGT